MRFTKSSNVGSRPSLEVRRGWAFLETVLWMARIAIISPWGTSCQQQACLSMSCLEVSLLALSMKCQLPLSLPNAITNFQEMGVKMSLKIHFLHSHLDIFPRDLGKISDEHGEKFHQTIQTIEKRYSGRADERLMADFCWFLKC